MVLLHYSNSFPISQTNFMQLLISHSKPSQRQSEMKAHIEQIYNVGYIPSFQPNTYHFPERATISTTPFQTLTLDRWPEAPPFQYQLLPQ